MHRNFGLDAERIGPAHVEPPLDRRNPAVENHQRRPVGVGIPEHDPVCTPEPRGRLCIGTDFERAEHQSVDKLEDTPGNGVSVEQVTGLVRKGMPQRVGQVSGQNPDTGPTQRIVLLLQCIGIDMGGYRTRTSERFVIRRRRPGIPGYVSEQMRPRSLFSVPFGKELQQQHLFPAGALCQTHPAPLDSYPTNVPQRNGIVGRRIADPLPIEFVGEDPFDSETVPGNLRNGKVGNRIPQHPIEAQDGRGFLRRGTEPAGQPAQTSYRKKERVSSHRLPIFS